LSTVRKLLLSLLLLMISLSFFGCGKKTSLFLNDRADSYRTVNHSGEGKHNNE
jgi:hypothetical protein